MHSGLRIRFASNFPFQVLEETVSSTVTSSQSPETQEDSRYSVSLKTQLADARRGSIPFSPTALADLFPASLIKNRASRVEGQRCRTAHAQNKKEELRKCSHARWTTDPTTRRRSTSECDDLH